MLLSAGTPNVTELSSFAPVVRHYPRGHCVSAHAHPWPQLLYASSGVLSVETDKGSWIVPPQRGVWLPPDCVHVTQMLTEVDLASLYLKDSAHWSFGCEVMEVSPLLRELIVAALRIDVERPRSHREKLLMGLIVEELRAAPRGVSPVPMPASERLLALCRRVIAEPSLNISLDEHATAAGLTAKTVSRLFDRELGIGFRQWRQMLHRSYAVAHLAQGTPAKVVASDLGYTASAFSAMLRRDANGGGGTDN
jgi:AraC-like DNA-binding protein